VNGEAVDKI